jgi:hypothetical protein
VDDGEVTWVRDTSAAAWGRRVRTLVEARLPIDAFLVAAAVLVALRVLGLGPWVDPRLDLHAYWDTRDGFAYATATPYRIGAFLYAPAFAQALLPLTLLPWQLFAGAWTALIVAVYVWLVGRWAFPVVLAVPVALELYLGQIDILLAAAIVIGFRYPAAWALPLLTKVAPGVGLVWFAVRREWRSLAVALGATLAVVTVSAALSPAGAWHGWFDLLRRGLLQVHVVEGAFVPIPVSWRLPFAVAVIAWGARTDRRWTVPVGVLLAMPILWANVFTLLIAVIPLREADLAPQLARTPAARWLQGRWHPLAGLRRALDRPGHGRDTRPGLLRG